MRLILSSSYARNSTYTNEAGQILYKVDKPGTVLGPEIATIRKAVGTVNGVWMGDFALRANSLSSERQSMDKRDEGNEYNPGRYSTDEEFNDSDMEDEAGPSTDVSPALEGHFAFYAQVEYNYFKTSRFRYNSLDVSVKDFFRLEGSSWFGR